MSDFLIPYPICMALFSGLSSEESILSYLRVNLFEHFAQYDAYSVSIESICSILILEITELSIPKSNQCKELVQMEKISQGDFTLHMLP